MSDQQWVVQQVGGQPPLSKGAYVADFVSAEFVTVDDPDTGGQGDRIRWTWRVATGPETGKLATALTDPVIKITNKAGRFVGGMSGQHLTPGDDVGALVRSFTGKRYLVMVDKGPKGGKESVQSVSQPPQM